jgi:hypothetical protein
MRDEVDERVGVVGTFGTKNIFRRKGIRGCDKIDARADHLIERTGRNRRQTCLDRRLVFLPAGPIGMARRSGLQNS